MECFYCGKEVTEDCAKIVYDPIRKRKLVFCSDFCKDSQWDGTHYLRFSHIRTRRKNLYYRGYFKIPTPDEFSPQTIEER